MIYKYNTKSLLFIILIINLFYKIIDRNSKMHIRNLFFIHNTMTFKAQRILGRNYELT